MGELLLYVPNVFFVMLPPTNQSVCNEDEESRDTEERHRSEDGNGDQSSSVDRWEWIQAVWVGEVSLLQVMPGRCVVLSHYDD